ncbi:hypothetical protein NQ315_010858 [Exocentrus adspersus]|uniref:Nuclease HARBI1 n=1 Tax=Exocentrus adspersus TaxID=1586481 RepID=A0AAV8VC19_9CUCU|nr:hypothetical protein NQ315_010858 [Exocentrus adspersus]
MEDFDEFVDYVNVEVRVPQIRLPKRYLRDMENPFEFYACLPFKRRYRFSKDTVQYVILPLVVEELQKPNHRGLPVSPIIQVLLCLRYLATGSYQTVDGDLRGLSQSTVSLTINRVGTAIARHLPEYVKFPEDNTENMQLFYAIAHFPGVTGCVDGTHIPIKKSWRGYRGSIQQ